MAVRMEGAVCGGAAREGWGERGRQLWRGAQSREPGEERLCSAVPTLTSRPPRGLPPPAHWRGAHADAPFSVFCRLGSASSCGEGKSCGSRHLGEGPPSVLLQLQPPPCTTGI